jgi:hypothetical protein
VIYKGYPVIFREGVYKPEIDAHGTPTLVPCVMLGWFPVPRLHQGPSMDPGIRMMIVADKSLTIGHVEAWFEEVLHE